MYILSSDQSQMNPFDSRRHAPKMSDQYKTYEVRIQFIRERVNQEISQIAANRSIEDASILYTLNKDGGFLAEQGEYNPAINLCMSYTGDPGTYHRTFIPIPVDILEQPSDSSAVRHYCESIIEEAKQFIDSIE